jgi:transcriptional regulator with XRE-family HTH domain
MSTTYAPSDEWIGATVKGVAGLKGVSLKRVALALGITPSALSNKIHGRATWSAVELAQVAELLNVEVGSLLDGYGGQVPFPRGLAADTTTSPMVDTHEYAPVACVTTGTTRHDWALAS